MKRGWILAEGQTEEKVVREVLAPHFVGLGLALDSLLLGGVKSFDSVENHRKRLMKDPSIAVVTTLIDYYKLQKSFPGMDSRPTGAPKGVVEHLERAWEVPVADRRFVAHFTLHEIETWALAEPNRLDASLFDDDPKVLAAIQRIQKEAKVHEPEHIDQGENTSPAKRLKRAFPAFDKTTHTSRAIAAVGLDAIRRTCPHAAAWLDRLEKIAQS